MHTESSRFDQFHVRRDRMFHTMRWKRPTIASALSVLALSVALTSQAVTSQAMAKGKTITAVMHSDLRIIDPCSRRLYHARSWLHGLRHAAGDGFRFQDPAADGGRESQR
jgi:peptide/nickel transport system substrate-binding protein